MGAPYIYDISRLRVKEKIGKVTISQQWRVILRSCGLKHEYEKPTLTAYATIKTLFHRIP